MKRPTKDSSFDEKFDFISSHGLLLIFGARPRENNKYFVVNGDNEVVAEGRTRNEAVNNWLSGNVKS